MAKSFFRLNKYYDILWYNIVLNIGNRKEVERYCGFRMKRMHSGIQIHLPPGFWMSAPVGRLMVRRTASSQISFPLRPYSITTSASPAHRSHIYTQHRPHLPGKLRGLLAWGSLQSIPWKSVWDEEYWNHPLSREEPNPPHHVSVLIYSGLRTQMARRLFCSSPMQTAPQTAGEATRTAGQRLLNGTCWNLVIWSWVLLELSYRGKPNSGTNCWKEEGIVCSLLPPFSASLNRTDLKLCSKDRGESDIDAGEEHPAVCYTLNAEKTKVTVPRTTSFITWNPA